MPTPWTLASQQDEGRSLQEAKPSTPDPGHTEVSRRSIYKSAFQSRARLPCSPAR